MVDSLGVIIAIQFIQSNKNQNGKVLLVDKTKTYSIPYNLRIILKTSLMISIVIIPNILFIRYLTFSEVDIVSYYKRLKNNKNLGKLRIIPKESMK